MCSVMNKVSSPLQRSSTGFTLIEMMIAIAIFAMLSLGAYQVLQGVLQSDEISLKRGTALKKLQRSMLVIERDMIQMEARNNRNDDELTAMPLQAGKFMFDSDDYGIAFTRGGWQNPLALLPRSDLQRISYRLKDKELQRLSFTYLDPAVGEEAKLKVLLTGVTEMTFAFHNEKEWLDAWSDKDALPSGIKMTIKTDDYGEIERQFLLPKGSVSGTSTTASATK